MGATYSIRVRRAAEPVTPMVSSYELDPIYKRIETLERKMTLLLIEREREIERERKSSRVLITTGTTAKVSPKIQAAGETLVPDNLSII